MLIFFFLLNRNYFSQFLRRIPVESFRTTFYCWAYLSGKNHLSTIPLPRFSSKKKMLRNSCEKYLHQIILVKLVFEATSQQILLLAISPIIGWASKDAVVVQHSHSYSVTESNTNTHRHSLLVVLFYKTKKWEMKTTLKG